MKKKRPKKTKTKFHFSIKNVGIILATIVLLVIIFNYPLIANYFRGLGQAQVLNITTDLPALNNNANQDVLQDLSADGFAYLSYNDLSIPPPPNSQQLRYHYLLPETDQLITSGDVGDFTLARTDNKYMVYQLAESGSPVHWRNLQSVTIDHTVPQNTGDYDYTADTWGGSIALVRRHNNKTNVWSYNIVTDTLQQLTDTDSEKKDIRYNANQIVWADQRNGNWDIYAYNLTTKQETQITTNIKNQVAPDISFPYIVWTDSRNVTTGNQNKNDDIYLYDLSASQERQITTNIKKQYSPSIYNQKIVWEDWRNQDEPSISAYNSDIYMYDLTTNQELVVTTNHYDQQSPKISGNQIFWTFVYPITPTGHPLCDINKATYDEFNLLAPADNLNFQFENINFQWEFSSTKTTLPNFWIKALWNGLPAKDLLPPNGEFNLGPITAFPLLSTRIELLPDGLWEWAVAPEINGQHTPYWSALRKVYKTTGASLTAPANDTTITLTPPTKFDWADVAGSKNYVLKIKGGKITGFLPQADGYYYIPLNNGGGTNSQLIIGPAIYNALETSKTYTWAIAGTALKNTTDGSYKLPTNDQRLPKLSYSATPRTFKK